jgi:hypothetical protein
VKSVSVLTTFAGSWTYWLLPSSLTAPPSLPGTRVAVGWEPTCAASASWHSPSAPTM